MESNEGGSQVSVDTSLLDLESFPHQEGAGLEEDQRGPSKPGSPGGLSQGLFVFFFLIVNIFYLFLCFWLCWVFTAARAFL